MNGQQLRDAAIKLYGDRGWQSQLAEALGRDVSSVRRWVSGQIPVPAPVVLAMQALAKKGRAKVARRACAHPRQGVANSERKAHAMTPVEAAARALSGVDTGRYVWADNPAREYWMRQARAAIAAFLGAVDGDASFIADRNEEVARILKIVANDGLPNPRDIDVAIDALDSAYALARMAAEP